METVDTRREEFERVWGELIAAGEGGDPYARGFERAMRIALGDTQAEAIIARVAQRYLRGEL